MRHLSSWSFADIRGWWVRDSQREHAALRAMHWEDALLYCNRDPRHLRSWGKAFLEVGRAPKGEGGENIYSPRFLPRTTLHAPAPTLHTHYNLRTASSLGEGDMNKRLTMRQKKLSVSGEELIVWDFFPGNSKNNKELESALAHHRLDVLGGKGLAWFCSSLCPQHLK